MKIHFYSKLVNTDSIVQALHELHLTDEEKAHLLGIVESSLHHAILDEILLSLSDEDKQIFLEYVTDEDNEKIWDFLNKKVKNIEEVIKKTADDLKTQLHKDIKQIRK